MVITVTCPSCSTSFPVDPAKIPEGGVNARCSSCGDVFRVEKPVEADPLPTLEDLAPTPEPLPTPTAESASTPAPPPLPGPEAASEPEEEVPAIADDWVVQTEETPAVEPDPLPSLAEDEPSFDASSFDDPSVAEPPAVEAPPMAEPEPSEESVSVSDPFSQPAPFEEAGPATGSPPPLPELDRTAPPVEPQAPPAEAPAPETTEPAVQGFTFGKRDPTDKAKRLARVLVSDMIMYNAERHQSALASGTLVQDFEEEIEKSWKEYVEQVGEDMANGAGRQFWTDALNDILAKGKQVF